MADTKIKNCKQCGCEFHAQVNRRGRPTIHCSSRCRYALKDGRKKEKQRAVWVGNCLHCKSEMVGRKRKFCTQDCRAVFYREVRPRLMGIMPWEERKALEKANTPESDCPACGVKFRATMSKKGQRRKFCSRQCHADARRVYSTEIERKAASKKRHYHRRAKRLGIRPFGEILRQAEQRRILMSHMRATCGTCDGKVEAERVKPNGQKPGVCSSCRAAKKRKAARIANSRRRARERAAKIESFDPLHILERDDWRCYICGIDTPKHKRGSYDADAPEVDHVIPLAAGGEHSAANCRCACRKCNGVKSDRLDFLQAA